jgi:hypothetical protein
MKNEKLELLLNKVVEFNKPDVVYCKGFLYKDRAGYYLKVVEGISGFLSYNDKHRLKGGDEQFIIVADKPKLMRVSLKSWHYRLIKFVLKSNAPTPKTMQNGCPYFWLLLFSLFACTFVAIWEVIKIGFMLLPNVLVWCLEKLVELWLPGVDDAEAYEYYRSGQHSSDYKMPITAKLYFDKSGDDFFDYFMLERYKIDRNLNPEAYESKKVEISAKHAAWKAEIAEKRQARSEKEAKERAEYQAKRAEYEHKHAIRQAEWDAKMQPVRNGLVGLGKSIKEAFTFDPKNLKNIIRRTKQIAGAFITLLLLGVTYFVVNGLAYGLTAFIDFSIEYWQIYVEFLILAAVIGIGYVLYVLFTGWIQSVVNKYRRGKKVWYIEPLIYLIFYPCKYIVLFIAYTFLYLVIKPLEVIFVKFLWKIVLVKTGVFLWKVLKSLGRGLVNSTGVFGEYFNASYTDYCPGIEWVDTENE